MCEQLYNLGSSDKELQGAAEGVLEHGPTHAEKDAKGRKKMKKGKRKRKRGGRGRR